LGKTPNPKDLIHPGVFKIMAVAYLLGLVLFSTGIILLSSMLLKTGAVCMLLTAVLYNFNVFKVINHKAVTI
jgi:hypothetical protein